MGVAEPSTGIQTEVVGTAATTSVRIPADGSATPAGVTTVNFTGKVYKTKLG